MRRSSLYPEQLLLRRAMKWSLFLEVNPANVLVTRLPGKWGSCAPDGVVTFAEDLAAADEEFQDFVIVHELLHLRYKSHNKLFRAAMTAYLPNWQTLERLPASSLE